MKHANLRIFDTYESYATTLPALNPTRARYYDTRVKAARAAAVQAVRAGAYMAEVRTTSGSLLFCETAAGYIECGG